MENKLPLDTVGERIRFVRSVLNLTQVYVAESMGITKQTLIRYEKNARKPNKNFLSRFANEFNADFEWLETGQGVPYNIFQAPCLPKVKYDRHLFYCIIIETERYLASKNRTLTPSKKADFILSLYEFYHDQQEDLRKQTKDKDFTIHVISIENAVKLLFFE